MGRTEDRLVELGLRLPPPLETPPGIRLPFAWTRRSGTRLYVSGHGPQGPEGPIVGPFGQVGGTVTEEEAYTAARLTALSMMGTLSRELGELDRVRRWLRVFGMVSSAPDFTRQPVVVNGFSDLVIAVFGDERGSHARSAVGMAALPFGMPIEVEAELEIEPD